MIWLIRLEIRLVRSGQLMWRFWIWFWHRQCQRRLFGAVAVDVKIQIQNNGARDLTFSRWPLFTLYRCRRPRDIIRLVLCEVFLFYISFFYILYLGRSFCFLRFFNWICCLIIFVIWFSGCTYSGVCIFNLRFLCFGRLIWGAGSNPVCHIVSWRWYDWSNF